MNVYKGKKQWKEHDINIPTSKAVKRSASRANWYMCDPTQTLVGSCVDEDFHAHLSPSLPFMIWLVLSSTVKNLTLTSKSSNGNLGLSIIIHLLCHDYMGVLEWIFLIFWLTIILPTIILHQHWLSITVNHCLMFHFNSNL